MQVSFKDSIKQELVINNPIIREFYLRFCIMMKMKYINKDNFSLNGLNTTIHELKQNNFKYIEIKSNIIFCRPLVIKYYDQYFDVFHA